MTITAVNEIPTRRHFLRRASQAVVATAMAMMITACGTALDDPDASAPQAPAQAPAGSPTAAAPAVNSAGEDLDQRVKLIKITVKDIADHEIDQATRTITLKFAAPADPEQQRITCQLANPAVEDVGARIVLQYPDTSVNCRD
ncbi:hypothetical protein BSA16_28675 [Micromonospora sp. Rc5]|nr:hypothetical protein [Micromonospora sp. DH15]OON28127.1 hypothetical protein BSA16_28675 [Micromonospora sp. Rc5]